MSLGGETRRWAAEASGYVLSSTHQPVQPEDQADPEVGRKYYYMKTYVGALETIYIGLRQMPSACQKPATQAA
jgi:hypothetical protein